MPANDEQFGAKHNKLDLLTFLPPSSPLCLATQDVKGLLTNVLLLHVTAEKVVQAADFAKKTRVESLFEKTELTCDLRG